LPVIDTLDELLVCSVCQSSLSWLSDEIVCNGCSRRFAVRAGSPDLTPNPPPDEDVREQWPLWELLQANGDLVYRANPELNLSVGARQDALGFGKFCLLTGSVLDVGCGPQDYPSYATGFDGLLVGIDPLRGAMRRDFAFVRGVGEYLPFSDSTFDRVLFATSLDHMLVPRRALHEAHRVVRPDGRVVVWMGVVIPGHRKPSPAQRAGVGLRLLASGQWREFGARVRATIQREPELETPEGAADPFHVSHPVPETVISWLEEAGLLVDRLERPSPDQCLISAKPSAGSKPNLALASVGSS
jgi:SAM-dependent methyltransferase